MSYATYERYLSEAILVLQPLTSMTRVIPEPSRACNIPLVVLTKWRLAQSLRKGYGGVKDLKLFLISMVTRRNVETWPPDKHFPSIALAYLYSAT